MLGFAWLCLALLGVAWRCLALLGFAWPIDLLAWLGGAITKSSTAINEIVFPEFCSLERDLICGGNL
jgi:hypothetical protein